MDIINNYDSTLCFYDNIHTELELEHSMKPHTQHFGVTFLISMQFMTA